MMNIALMFDIAAGCLLVFFAVRGAIAGLSGEIGEQLPALLGPG